MDFTQDGGDAPSQYCSPPFAAAGWSRRLPLRHWVDPCAHSVISSVTVCSTCRRELTSMK